LGFGLSLLAAAASSLAGGATLIRCEEPDGCVEIEFVARSAMGATACGGHEHEEAEAREASSPSSDPADRIDPVGTTSHPCEDTVIASLSDAVRLEKRLSLPAKWFELAPIVAPALRSFGARDSIESVIRSSRRDRAPPRHRPSSVVLRF